MRNKSFLLRAFIVAMVGLLLASAPDARAAQYNKAHGQLSSPADRGLHRHEGLEEKVRQPTGALPFSRGF